MADERDLKRRLRAIKNTQQITRAMKMVAAAKLRRSQERLVAARPYADQVRETLARLLSRRPEGYSHPLLEVRPERKVAYVIVTGDRGLAGSYNANIIRKSFVHLREPRLAGLVAVGRKGRDFWRRRGKKFLAEFIGLGEEATFTQARAIARTLIDMFQEGIIDEVRIIFTQFRSALSQQAVELVLLPITESFNETRPEETAGEGTVLEHIYEPSPEAVLDALLPKYVEIQVYRILMEAKASEHGARMAAMSAATDNAAELIEELTLEFNRVRQAGITRELSEIIGGAAALQR